MEEPVRFARSNYTTFTAPTVCQPEGLMGGQKLLSAEEVQRRLKGLRGWQVVEGHILTRTFAFSTYTQTRAFAMKVQDFGNLNNQMPQIALDFTSVRVDLWTQALGGLTAADFALAEQIDEVRDMP